MDDVTAFMCRRVGLPIAAERSRSGAGAHVWFFFSAPVSASVARKIGCYLITETMTRRHQLGMDSYDRLFPSQDTMPRGGFGNLIALPLQHEPRKHANSVFVDDQLRPYPDDQQWIHLASVGRIDPGTAEMVARVAARHGSVIGVRLAETADDSYLAPWARLPSRKVKPVVIAEPYFAGQLGKFTRHLVVLQGGMSAKERREVKERLDSIPDGEERLVLATGRYIGEGFDDARLDTLFLALPVSWKGTLIQYTGRLHRLHPNKAEVQIFDYVDRAVPMLLRMFEKRLRSYRGIGYARGEAPLGFAQPADDIIVEYDQDVLRALKELGIS